MIYWPANVAAVVPTTIEGGHVTVPVTVDGHDFTAMIDTGASTSTMRLDNARVAFGLTPDSARHMKAAGHIGNDETALIYEHPFKTLTFEGVTVNNPKIRILTDIMGKNADHRPQIGSYAKSVSDDVKLPAIIIGMDVLRRLRVYFALTERRLYLTDAGTPSPAPERHTAS